MIEINHIFKNISDYLSDGSPSWGSPIWVSMILMFIIFLIIIIYLEYDSYWVLLKSLIYMFCAIFIISSVYTNLIETNINKTHMQNILPNLESRVGTSENLMNTSSNMIPNVIIQGGAKKQTSLDETYDELDRLVEL